MTRRSTTFFAALAVIWSLGCGARQKLPTAEPESVAPLSRPLGAARKALGQSPSGFLAINHGEDALAWRLALIDHAEKTIAVQSYIWHGDESGVLLAHRLMLAAARGVEVRILVDDLPLLGRSKRAAFLDRLPNLEIRLFNPFRVRGNQPAIRGIEFVARKELNHRMHNKLLVVDDAIAILGSRNVGNEYFGATDDAVFRDLDVIAFGAVAEPVRKVFDEYWNSKRAHAIETLVRDRKPSKSERKATDRMPTYLARAEARFPGLGSGPRDWSARLASLVHHAHPGSATPVYDEPDSQTPMQARIALRKAAEDVEDEIWTVSPYLVPNEGILERLRGWTKRGVEATVLTNSLASNDVTLTNSFYKKYRKALIRAGADLYELRAEGRARAFYRTAPTEPRYLGLHAKVSIVDRRRVFVGSMNLDPRSFYLNTEVALVIESPSLAEDILESFERDFHPDNSWHVTLDKRGAVRWTSSAGTRRTQPARSFFQRLADFLGRMLPLEKEV